MATDGLEAAVVSWQQHSDARREGAPPAMAALQRPAAPRLKEGHAGHTLRESASAAFFPLNPLLEAHTRRLRRADPFGMGTTRECSRGSWMVQHHKPLRGASMRRFRSVSESVQVMTLMTYEPSLLGGVPPAAAFLGWQTAGEWTNAVLGNIGPAGSSALTVATIARRGKARSRRRANA
jgi:hypothetical protein